MALNASRSTVPPGVAINVSPSSFSKTPRHALILRSGCPNLHCRHVDRYIMASAARAALRAFSRTAAKRTSPSESTIIAFAFRTLRKVRVCLKYARLTRSYLRFQVVDLVADVATVGEILHQFFTFESKPIYFRFVLGSRALETDRRNAARLIRSSILPDVSMTITAAKGVSSAAKKPMLCSRSSSNTLNCSRLRPDTVSPHKQRTAAFKDHER